MNRKEKCTAIVLAGGQGKRMGTNVQKQYLHIQGKPVLYYSLHTFENSGIIDEIVLVIGEGQTDYVRREFVEKYRFSKVKYIVEGGKERYDSVWEGLKAIRKHASGYVFIHDSARPFVNEEILKRGYEGVSKYRACVVGMPSKDTVKLVDEETFAKETPDRNYVWIIQTPQIFDVFIIIEAYEKMMEKEHTGVTDDAMVVEREMKIPVRMIEGSYENIKITTPEDLDIAEVFSKRCFLQ